MCSKESTGFRLENNSLLRDLEIKARKLADDNALLTNALRGVEWRLGAEAHRIALDRNQQIQKSRNTLKDLDQIIQEARQISLSVNALDTVPDAQQRVAVREPSSLLGIRTAEEKLDQNLKYGPFITEKPLKRAAKVERLTNIYQAKPTTKYSAVSKPKIPAKIRKNRQTNEDSVVHKASHISVPKVTAKKSPDVTRSILKPSETVKESPASNEHFLQPIHASHIHLNSRVPSRCLSSVRTKEGEKSEESLDSLIQTFASFNDDVGHLIGNAGNNQLKLAELKHVFTEMENYLASVFSDHMSTYVPFWIWVPEELLSSEDLWYLKIMRNDPATVLEYRHQHNLERLMSILHEIQLSILRK